MVINLPASTKISLGTFINLRIKSILKIKKEKTKTVNIEERTIPMAKDFLTFTISFAPKRWAVIIHNPFVNPIEVIIAIIKTGVMAPAMANARMPK